MKRALYIGGFELPDKNAAAQRVIGIAKILKELEIDTLFYGLTKEENFEGVINGFRYIQNIYPQNTFQWFKQIVNINKIVKLIEDEKIDYVFAYNFPSVALYRLKKYCKSKNIKIYADVTEWYEPNIFSVSGFIKKIDTEFRMRYVHKKLDGVISISHYLYEYYKDKLNTVQIPPTVDITDKKWQRLLTLDRIDTSLTFVYAGSPGNGKKDKINDVIEFLSKIDESFIFNVVGLTREEYLNNFGCSEKFEKIENKIRFHGRVPHEKALEYVYLADYCIFFRDDSLTNNAGFPTKLVEAVTCGTKVVCNKEFYDIANSEPQQLFLNNNMFKNDVYFIKKEYKINNEYCYKRYVDDLKQLTRERLN